MTSWAHLNEEGIAQWSDVFPENTVPIRSILPARAVLSNIKPGDGPEEQNVYIVNVTALKPETVDKLVAKIAAKFNAPPEEVRKSIVETDGMVLRTSLTNGAGTDDLHHFTGDLEDTEDEEYDEETDGEDDFGEEDVFF